jgi:hypothetical protein
MPSGLAPVMLHCLADIDLRHRTARLTTRAAWIDWHIISPLIHSATAHTLNCANGPLAVHYAARLTTYLPEHSLRWQGTSFSVTDMLHKVAGNLSDRRVIRSCDIQDHNRDTLATGAHVGDIRAGQEPGSVPADRI